MMAWLLLRVLLALDAVDYLLEWLLSRDDEEYPL